MRPDTGMMMTPDAGRRDGGMMMMDRCAADMANAISTVGCNGGVILASAPDNEFGGRCTAEMDGPGTCTNPMGLCAGREGGPGICLQTCTPSASRYVSRGNCPMGSRCFDLGMVAICFPDCNSDADCTSMNCDEEGSCLAPAGMMMMTDGGMPGADAGMPVDAGAPVTDGGMP